MPIQALLHHSMNLLLLDAAGEALTTVNLPRMGTCKTTSSSSSGSSSKPLLFVLIVSTVVSTFEQNRLCGKPL
jgi:hypothetical protein